jgi:hypothetical protein
MFPKTSARFALWLKAVLVAGASVGLAGPGRADVLHLRNGQQVKGVVSAYANLVFEVYPDNGKKTQYQAAAVDRIEFDERAGSATVDTRSKGALTGKITDYHGSAFTLARDNGQTENLPSIFVTSIHFPAAFHATDAEQKPVTTGDEVDVAEHVVAGKITLVEFYGYFDQSNVASRLVTRFLENLVKDDPALVLVKINIAGWDSPVAKQYQVTAIPRVEIYNRAKQRVTVVEGNRQPEILSAIKKLK